MHIIDRRLNPGSKSLENRQRFLRRAKALVQGAVKKSSQDRDIKDVLEGDGEDAFRFVLSRDEFVDLFLDDLELPDLAKRKLAQAESEGLRRAGYTTSGSPANLSVSRTVRLALARRVALKRPRAETIAELEAELADCDEARRVVLLAEIEALKTKLRRIPF